MVVRDLQPAHQDQQWLLGTCYLTIETNIGLRETYYLTAGTNIGLGGTYCLTVGANISCG